MSPERAYFLEQWSKDRALWIEKYYAPYASRSAKEAARFWVLHYGRLVRLMRRGRK